MGLADADGAGDEQAAPLGLDGEAVDEAAGAEQGGLERAVGAGELGLEAVEGAVFVAARNLGALEQARGAAPGQPLLPREKARI